MLNQVFLSYRHESQEHARAVRRLGEVLSQAGIPVALDQFYLDKYPGGPSAGWAKWCEDCANKSACVLIMASEGWFAAYEKDESHEPPDTGIGAAWEADLFREDIWHRKGQNDRIRLAFLHNVAADKVPMRLRMWRRFRPFDGDDELNALIKWAADCLGLIDIELPTVRWPDPVAGFQPDLADRSKKEWPAIVELLAGRSRKRILLYEGGSGLGKSELLNQAVAYARRLDIKVLRIDFRGGTLKLDEILGQFDLELGEHLPNFSREGANKTHLLRKDLRALRQPVLLIFDGYEDAAENKIIADWLNLQFLTEVETSLGLAIIVAGQRVPDHSRFRWHDLALHFPLEPIVEIEHWRPWVERHYPNFRADLRTLLLLSEGNPMSMSRFCEVISKAST